MDEAKPSTVQAAYPLSATSKGTWWGKTAVEVIEALRDGHVTPLELVHVAEARIRATDDAVNATPVLCPARAREHARRLASSPRTS
ncbi:amidase, partial [Nannochloropsis gaditana CCMP526]|uniref:amidase n=1 Tax=Nannochloropsis gaditana (strain CCMP526) TaxID=1093141 RepID=UPI00029F753A